MTDIQKRLFTLQDAAYADFQARLTPAIPRERFIGVRVPELRKLAGELKGTATAAAFLKALPHDYYDENMLYSLLLADGKDFAACIAAVEAFLPYVDNWAVCDILSPGVFKKHKAELLPYLRLWAASEQVYTCRFGIEMLMSHYLDEDFFPEVLAIPAKLRSEEYYVNMMIAWFFATALAKQWDAAVPYLENGSLGTWVHNKTIQKSVESYRITDEQKTYLRSLKRK